MFTAILSKTSKLDRAIALSVAAMLSFNVVVLANQLQVSPQVAQSQGTSAQLA
ncbi:MAG: hypothetical protein ABL881_01955 [Novosphingobium sp.]